MYSILINRFKANEKIQSPSGTEAVPPPVVQGDRSELSRIVSALREAECREEQPEQTAHLRKLGEEINSGNYRVDVDELASAMLRPPEGS